MYIIKGRNEKTGTEWTEQKFGSYFTACEIARCFTLAAKEKDTDGGMIIRYWVEEEKEDVNKAC